MPSPRTNAAGPLSTLALAILALAWGGPADATPPVRGVLAQSVHAGFQDYEEEDDGEGEGVEEYADEEGDSGEEEYAGEESESAEDEGESGEEEYAGEEDAAAGEEYAGEEGDSGEEETADEEGDPGEEAYADDEGDSGAEDDSTDAEALDEADAGEDESSEEALASGDEEAEAGDDAEASDDGESVDEELAVDEDPEAYADEDDTEYLEDYEDDSWAPEYVEVEADDAIPIDDETWGDDVVWEVVEVEEVDGSGSVDEETEESDEDSVGAGELMVVRSAKRAPASRPGSRPAPRPAPRPGPKPAASAGDDEDTPYSYGGRPVSALSVPWQAEIFNPKAASKPAADGKPAWQRQHYCGGSLIARDWVLTAAHCIDQQLVDYGFKVRLGMTDLSKGDGLTYRIDRIVRHSQYNAENNDPAKPPNMYANDIALIHIVDDGAPQRRDPKRIREIPLNRQPLTPGVPVSATGWGVTGTGDADVASAVILRVDLQLMATPVCQARPKFGPQKIHGNVFCAANPERSTCRGDSGGPVVLTNKAPVLVGVVSWGKRKCSGDGRPGVYTRVDRYLDWIDKAMKLPPNKSALP